jgi:hypothetical protein
MKQLILLCCLLFVTIAAQSQTTNLIGKWIVDEDGDTSYLEFTADSLVYLSYDDVSSATGTTKEGGRNYTYQEGLYDSVMVDFCFKTNPAKPNHLYFVMYHTGTKKPYLIIPIFMVTKPDKSVYLYILETTGENTTDDGILYQSPQDWLLADKTITQASNEDLNDTEKLILTRIK